MSEHLRHDGVSSRRLVNWRVVGMLLGMLIFICLSVVVADYVSVRDRGVGDATTKPGK